MASLCASELFSHDPPNGVNVEHRLVNLAVATNISGVRYKQSNMPFVQMENIAQFLAACEKPPLNLPSHDRFLTVDLYDSKDPAQVLQCIAAFSRRANQLNPSNFPATLGAKSKNAMSPQGTGSSGPRSPAYTTTAGARPRGASNAAPDSPSITFNPLNKAAYSGRMSPTKTTLGRGGLATGGAISSWSSKADEGKTAPAWNIHQYGYMGGASQGNQGVAFGARRQITSPAPNVPSLAEKEKRLREEAERKQQEQDEYERQQRAQREAEEQQARLEEERRWAEETQRAREQEAAEQRAAERQRLQEEERVRKEEQRRKELQYEREREREAQDAAEREARNARDQQRTTSDNRLNGQFLSQYQSDQARSNIAGMASSRPLVQQQTAESQRIAELERQLEEMKAQQRQSSSRQAPPPPAEVEPEPAPPALPSRNQTQQTSHEDDWAESERDYLRQEWQKTQDQGPPKPPRPEPAQSSSSRPLPDPAAYQAGTNRTDRYLATNAAPAPPNIGAHRPQDYSTTTEVDLENQRRIQSQQKTKAGGWASKSLLEREMERERERQREWEDSQKDTASRARDIKEGSNPGQSWDVHQYGYMGGDSQNRGGPGLGVGGARRQIIGPRPPP
jgi:transgelin